MKEPSKFQMKKNEQFILCGRTPNLDAYDIVEQSKIMRDGLDTTFEISNLVEFSSINGTRFEKLNFEKKNMHFAELRVLCLITWSVRAES